MAIRMTSNGGDMVFFCTITNDAGSWNSWRKYVPSLVKLKNDEAQSISSPVTRETLSTSFSTLSSPAHNPSPSPILPLTIYYVLLHSWRTALVNQSFNYSIGIRNHNTRNKSNIIVNKICLYVGPNGFFPHYFIKAKTRLSHWTVNSKYS